MKTSKTLYLTIMLMVLSFATTATAAQKELFKLPGSAIQQSLQTLENEVKANKHTFTVGYSSALKLPIEKLCGLKEPSEWLETAPIEKRRKVLATLPASFDWRDMNGVTAVKNQKNCGSCWAFGTVAPLESQLQLKCNIAADLSEQFLVSGNIEGWGCSGGWWAHNYHLNKLGTGETAAGAVKEADFPYQAVKAPTKGPYQHPFRITNWSYVAGAPNPSVQAVKQAIYAYGPIAGAVYVGPKFQAYASGIFDADEKGKVNHAIVLVGWNDDLGTDNGYWILKNSWGTGWGENGYMRIRYGKNQVGYAANYIQFVCNDATPAPTQTNTYADLNGLFSNLALNNGGHQIFGSLQVTNSGQAAAATCTVQLYLSKDGKTKGQYLGATTLKGLAPGENVSLSFNKYTTPGVFTGKYLLAIIDSDSRIKESNEDNNNVTKLVQ